MPTFAFTATVTGLSLDAIDQLDALYTDDFVIVPAEVDGVTSISVEIDAPTGEVAFKTFRDHLAETAPTVVVTRVDDDLVNIPEIADRLDLTRQAVTMLVSGARGDGMFPAHRAVIGTQKVWPWANVFAWATVTGRLPEGMPHPVDETCVTWINGQLVPSDALGSQRSASWSPVGNYSLRTGVEPAREYASRSGDGWAFTESSLRPVRKSGVAA